MRNITIRDDKGLPELICESVHAQGYSAAIRRLSRNRNQCVSQESEPLIADLEESYGYTSDSRSTGSNLVQHLYRDLDTLNKLTLPTHLCVVFRWGHKEQFGFSVLDFGL